MIPRRTFFKVGFTGALLLGGAYSITRSLEFKNHPDFRFFDSADVENLKAISFSILQGTQIKEDELISVVKGIEVAVLGLTPIVQKEVKELLLLFKWRPLRWSTGRNRPWSEASVVEMEELLNSWKLHRISLFRGAYGALCELVNASYYANPSHWEQIGYPGPMELDE